MRLFQLLFFLTFVVACPITRAAPQTSSTVESTSLSAEPDPTLISTHPLLREEPLKFYVNMSLGYAGGQFLERDKYFQGGYLTLRYLPLEKEQIVWDYGLELFSKNILGLSMGRRWYCCPGDEFMPYARASANIIIDPQDQLAGLAEIRRWRLRAALGIGESFISEIGVGLAATGYDIYAQFGYNLGF